MHFFQLLRRRKSSGMRAEPRAFTAGHILTSMGMDMPQADSDRPAMFGECQPEEELRDSEAIFGLIGSRPVPESGTMSRTSARVDEGDLIASLHGQYCQALDNPLGPVSRIDWESPSESSGRYARDASAPTVDPHLHLAGQDSIEALLSGARLLDQIFGPLRESDLGNLPESEPVPEILRLFAPPEYLASAFRSMAALPPALARREHHSPGIDSPLPMPEVNLTGDSP